MYVESSERTWETLPVPSGEITEVGCTETLSAPRAGRESDQTIVLGDGSAVRMGKGLTMICSLHRKHVPDS